MCPIQLRIGLRYGIKSGKNQREGIFNLTFKVLELSVLEDQEGWRGSGGG